MMHTRGSEGQQRDDKIFMRFCTSALFFLFTVHCSLFTAYAESISDIKLEALNEPAKERWGRDPFIRYEDKTAKLKGKRLREDAPPDLRISGIISDGKKAMAIINGGFYRKKDRVNDFLIVDIAKDKVSLEKNGKRFYLGVEKFTIDAYKGKDRDELKGKAKKDSKDKEKKKDKEEKE